MKLEPTREPSIPQDGPANWLGCTRHPSGCTQLRRDDVRPNCLLRNVTVREQGHYRARLEAARALRVSPEYVVCTRVEER